MKEATGELNVTAIVVISIGILSAFFFSVVWPMLNDDFDSNARCADAVCVCAKGQSPNCKAERESGVINCYLPDNEDNTFTCDYTG